MSLNEWITLALEHALCDESKSSGGTAPRPIAVSQ